MSGGAQRRAHRALRSAALRLAEAQWNRTDAIVAAHQAGVSMPEIGRQVGLDAFGVRDELVRAGELDPLRPKGSVAAAGALPGRTDGPPP